MDDTVAVQLDRRRLRRDVPWRHSSDGLYSTQDDMHGVRRVKKGQWQRGVHQPYHQGTDTNALGGYDFSSGTQFHRLRDAQAATESEESERPRRSTQQTIFRDRRGL